MAHFEALPNELLTKVIGFLDKKSLAQVRLVNTRLEQISVKQLFAKVTLYPQWKKNEPTPLSMWSDREFRSHLFPDKLTVDDDGWDESLRGDLRPGPSVVNKDGEAESSKNGGTECLRYDPLPDPPTHESLWDQDDCLPNATMVNEDRETELLWIDTVPPKADSSEWDQFEKEYGPYLRWTEPLDINVFEEWDPSWKNVVKTMYPPIPKPQWASDGLPGPLHDTQRFRNILDSLTFRQLVKEVHIYTCKTDCDHHPMLIHQWHYNENFSPMPVFDTNYMRCIQRLGEFPNLHNLTVHFDRHSGEDRDSDREYLFQDAAFKSLWIRRILQVDMQRIKELGVQHLDNFPNTENELPILLKNAVNLTSLRLNIVHPQMYEAGGYTLTDGPIHSFWIKFPDQFLAPKQQSLTTLVLYSDLPLGWLPKLDLQKVHFAQLRSLTLGQHIFHHNDQVDWIMSHASTLEEMNLDHCSVLYDIGNPILLDKNGRPQPIDSTSSLYEYSPSPSDKLCSGPFSLRWHDIFSSFTELHALQEFRFGSSKQWQWDTRSRYFVSSGIAGHPVMPWEDEKNIKNEILESRYLVYNNYNRGYCQKWPRERWCDCDDCDDSDHVLDQRWREELKGQFEQYPDCEEADQAALKALLDKVKGR